MSEQVNTQQLKDQIRELEQEKQARNEMLAALSESEKRSRIRIDKIQAGVVIYDKETRVIKCNPKIQEWLGLSESQMFGKDTLDPVWDFLDEERLPMAREFHPVSLVKESLKPLRDYLMGVQRSDGALLWFVVNGDPVFDDEQQLVEIVITFMDVSDYKLAEEDRNRLERRLLQTQKLEAIGTLAAGIAHDFNNILSGIFGYAYLAELSVETPEKVKKHLGQILVSAERAAELVQQIMTYGRQAENKRRPVTLYVVVKESVKMLRSTIPSTIEIRQNVSSKSEIMADPVQIHQVIMNLCANAFQAMKTGGGVLTIGLYNQAAPSEDSDSDLAIPPGEYLVLEISDTGVGMDQDTRQKMFDPYFTTRGLGEGTGLGLSTVIGIVEDHAGYVKVDSSPGQGTRFHVFFPLLESQAPEADDFWTGEQLSGMERVMFIDDEAPILNSNKDLLEKFGYQVTPFFNAKDALEAFKQNPTGFDIIITDMTMPRMTGAALAKEVLDIRADIPIILCSGYTDEIDKEGALFMGIKKYLTKPVKAVDIIKSIRQVLDH